jgi:hypothetical protein
LIYLINKSTDRDIDVSIGSNAYKEQSAMIFIIQVSEPKNSPIGVAITNKGELQWQLKNQHPTHI